MSLAVKVEDLSKRYRLGVINRDMLYKDLQSRWAKFRGKPDPNAPVGRVHRSRIEKGDEFWALRNLDLQIGGGEIVGIIGRNGAGKSTLLKILSQITAPTEGRVSINGRMASLLEVGTGFHPELTGRENIFLNGAILGMTRNEVKSQFSEIVEFSGLKEFIDTPVKRYSSGMYVRLGFAVAAHLNTEILIVDEVLAVGDASFRNKCLGKMRDVAGSGKTVLFVSHDLGSVSNLCSKTALLDGGQLVRFGETEQVVRHYLEKLTSSSGAADMRHKDSDAFITKIATLQKSGQHSAIFAASEAVAIQMSIKVTNALNGCEIFVRLHDERGSLVFHASENSGTGDQMRDLASGVYTTKMTIPSLFLAPGRYSLTCGIQQQNVRLIDLRQEALHFEISQVGLPQAVLAHLQGGIGSVVFLEPWEIIHSS